MERFFNTAGPVVADDHYHIPPLSRLDLDEVLRLIGQKKCFVLHAPRQTGKTSALLALEAYLNKEGSYVYLYVNVEMAQAARENLTYAMRSILDITARNARDRLGDDRLIPWSKDLLAEDNPVNAFEALLRTWCQNTERPIVLLLDEVDALIGDSLISLLRQLRAGYTHRPQSFPQSVVLCGIRDVRDYRIHSSTEKTIITGGSAFNVKAESLRVGSFSRSEVEALYQQHTEATGQIFEPEAIDFAFELTEGQPWLVNALAYEVCFAVKAQRDRSLGLTKEMIEVAQERLIQRRDTHLDQLVDKLREPRVYRVIEPILSGAVIDPAPDDLQYVVDLGLVEQAEQGVVIANPIYREIIPRELNTNAQLNFQASHRSEWYLTEDGRLDMTKLLEGFQAFWRENADIWVERFQYKEAGPHLILQAFLQRVVNGGGRIEREYALGRQRTDLLVRWPLDKIAGFLGPVQRVVLELKVLRASLDKTIEKGREQIAAYMDQVDATEGHFLIFDRSSERPWDERIFHRTETLERGQLTVWGL